MIENKKKREEMNDLPIISLIRDIDRCIKDRDDMVFKKIHFKPRFVKLYFDIFNNDGITQSQLVLNSKLKPPSISTTLVQMEHEGYIERRVDAEDLRRVRIYMTEKGKKRKESIQTIIKKNEKVLLSNLKESEVNVLRDLLIRIRENISSEGKI